ncbi:MAG: allantoate amidohydrolase [Protaetiibacter sp.]
MLLSELRGVGADRASGGVDRRSWSAAELECRSWFMERAGRAGLETETDRNGNLWAWWGHELPGTAVVTGSHLDSVPAGGEWDGPLGVVSGFAAVERLRAEGYRPRRPVAVVAFTEEEGSRFGLACLGSRLMTGAVDADRACTLRDADGITLPEAMTRAGADARGLGADPDRLARIGAFVEVHIEQGHLPLEHRDGYGLAEAGSPLGVLSRIWPHGRWRIDLTGRQDHAGTTRMGARSDPVVAMAQTILEVRRAALEHDVLATVGRVAVHPGAVNAIAGSASVWIDARGGAEDAVRAFCADVTARVGRDAVAESWTDVTVFDEMLGEVVARAAERASGVPLPRLPSGAGHDAGVLALAGIPTAMIAVRNPTGVSHAPDEQAEEEDARTGVASLAEVLRECAG